MLDTAQELYNAIPRPTIVEMVDQLWEDKRWQRGPQEATIRDWIRKNWITLDADDGPWSIATGTAAEAALALPFMGWHAKEPFMPRAGLAPHRPRRRVVKEAVRLHSAFPELDEIGLLFALAAAVARGGDDLERAESFMAFTPWRDNGEALISAFVADQVDFVVTGFSGFDIGSISARAALAKSKEETRER